MSSGSAAFFKAVQRDIKKLEKDLARKVVQVEAEKFHERNFRREGFTDRSFKPWPARKKKETPKRSLLVKSSTLKGHALKGRNSGNQVDFFFPLPYMKVHNEGGSAGRGQGFKMPKRQFVGNSAVLRRQINRKARIILNRRLNNL